jgi:SpoVK/Ycf46/Vps4 family AAA+-type ATPase
VNFNGDRIDDFREMSWGDIIMAPGLLSDIRDEMDSFFSGFDMYKDRNLSWRRGMLLAGPPGNGKTAICRAVATAAKVPVIYCATTDADLFGMLSQVQVTMVQHAPCILVFEDADSVGGDDIMRSAMLNMMDGMFSCDGVFTIATTNCPEKLTSAISGRPSRFDSFYVIGNPGPDERRKILISKLGKSAKDLPPKDVDKVVLDTGDMSAACLQEIAICALKASMAKKGKLLPAYVHAAVNRVKKHISISRDGLDMMSRGFAGFSMNNDEPRGLQTKYPKN